jgi:hypothetical protein
VQGGAVDRQLPLDLRGVELSEVVGGRGGGEAERGEKREEGFFVKSTCKARAALAPHL